MAASWLATAVASAANGRNGATECSGGGSAAADEDGSGLASACSARIGGACCSCSEARSRRNEFASACSRSLSAAPLPPPPPTASPGWDLSALSACTASALVWAAPAAHLVRASAAASLTSDTGGT